MKRKHLAAAERRRRAATLAELAGQEVDVFCWCNRCGHNAVIGTGRLIATLGADFPVPEVGARLRCSRCGAKEVATRPDWPSLGQVARHA
jgi:hypothetical protein